MTPQILLDFDFLNQMHNREVFREHKDFRKCGRISPSSASVTRIATIYQYRLHLEYYLEKKGFVFPVSPHFFGISILGYCFIYQLNGRARGKLSAFLW